MIKWEIENRGNEKRGGEKERVKELKKGKRERQKGDVDVKKLK